MSRETELRWYLTNRWGDSDSHAKVLELIDEIVGYPPKAHPDDSEQEGSWRVALVVGHNARHKGAFCAGQTNQFEYDYNNEVANLVIAKGIAHVAIKRFNRVYSGSYSQEIRTCYKKVNAWDPHLIIEMHFNGGGGNYTSQLVAAGYPKTATVGAAVQQVFVDELGFRDYGLMKRTENEDGGGSLYAGNAPTVLTEPFFGDNPDHQLKVGKLGHAGMALVYRKAIVAGLTVISNR